MKNKEKVNSFKNYVYMLKFITKHTPALVVGYLFIDVLANLPWTLSNVVLLKYILDVVSEGEGFYRIGAALIFFVVFVVITNLLTTVFYEISMPKQKEKLYFAIYKTIYEKAAKMDYEAYDNPEFYNDLAPELKDGETKEVLLDNIKPTYTSFILPSSLFDPFLLIS